MPIQNSTRRRSPRKSLKRFGTRQGNANCNSLQVHDLLLTADRINTGTDSPDTSRALVLFNRTCQPVSGVAVFRASMSWPRDVPLPPVVVMDQGKTLPLAVRDLTDGADAKGRPDRHRLSFSLCFAVSDVPANGWRTYIAAYADTPSPALEDFVETPGLVVVETTRHGGDLPPVGNF